METQETWEQRRDRENLERREKNLANLTHVFNAIQEPVKKLGLLIELTDINQQGEKSEHEIKITMPCYPDFLCSIIGRQWNNEDRASMWFKTDRTVTSKDGEYSDGSPRWSNERYEFSSYFEYHEEEKYGLKKIDYRYPLSQLNVAFKATKNPKLILRDVMPAIEKYVKIVLLISPRIDAKIKKENNVLAIQQKVAMHLGDHVPQSIGKHTFTCSIGRFEISEYGNVTWTQEINLEKLEALMEAGQIVKTED